MVSISSGFDTSSRSPAVGSWLPRSPAGTGGSRARRGRKFAGTPTRRRLPNREPLPVQEQGVAVLPAEKGGW